MTTSYVCTVEGKVTGGTFEGFVQELAERLQLKGWVRFISDAKAEILLQGEAKDYEAFRQALNSDAPVPGNKNIACRVEEHDKAYDGFSMR